MDKQLAAAKIVEECYTTGNFEKLLSIITDDYEHHSFWVLEPMRGKEAVTPILHRERKCDPESRRKYQICNRTYIREFQICSS